MFYKSLPVLFVRIEGSVSTNIAEFKTEIDSYVSSINKELVTDEHFGRAELDVKFCKKTEKQLVNAREAALNQSMDIKTTMDLLGSMGENIRQVRLRLEKLVKREKENRKDAIVSVGCDACLEHIKMLNAELQGFYLPVTDYQILMRDAIKGMKTLESMEEAADGVVIEYRQVNNELAELMNRNIECLNVAKKNGYAFLFNDFDQYVHLDNEHVGLMILGRISEHKTIEAKKEKIEEERRLKAAKRLAAVEMAKQKEAAEEAVCVAKEEAVVEERERVAESERMLNKQSGLFTDEQLGKEQPLEESKQKIDFDYNDNRDYGNSGTYLDVSFNSKGEINIEQDSEEYYRESVYLTIESLKEILEKVSQ